LTRVIACGAASVITRLYVQTIIEHVLVLLIKKDEESFI
jgi:hypothetical protein